MKTLAARVADINYHIPSKELSLLLSASRAAIDAGTEIMKVYRSSSFGVQYKKDASPLTLADQAAHEAIMQVLTSENIPVLSEEGADIGYDERKQWEQLWMVDPLDGTKEFLKRNGEFTVNIALVKNNSPVIGVIYVPVTQELYYAVKGKGAYKTICKKSTGNGPAEGDPRLYPTVKDPNLCRILVSRSHMGEEIKHFISEKEKKFNRVELLSRGSALKFCMIAEGQADCYPRYRPCMEWDTAAGQLIVEEAGKKLIDLQTRQPMLYNRTNLRNAWFVVE